MPSGACRACQREATARYRAKNPERWLAYYAKSNAKPETKARISAWQKNNRDKHATSVKAHYARNSKALIAKAAERHRTNREAQNISVRAWRKRNRAICNELCARRRAVEKRATTAWGQEGVREFYAKARELGLSVDHIIPLRHPLVCGLHNIHNLQLMTRIENSRKTNTWEPS